MSRRRSPAPAIRRGRPLSAARPLAVVGALAVTLALAACSVPLNPGPGTDTFDAEATAAPAPQIGEASEPVVVARAKDGERIAQADGTVVVRPAPKTSSDTDDGDGSGGANGGGAGGSSGSDGDSGGGSDGGGSADGGSGADDAPADLSDSAQYAAVLESEVNERRQAGGLSALTHDDCAYQVALERAEALRGQDLAHAPLGPIFDRCPTSTVGENLARGGWTPAEAADGWMNSEGHRANILNASFTRGAIACIAEGTQYGTQMTCAHVFLG